MCKIARFREFVRQAQASYTRVAARLWAKRVFVHFLLLLFAFGSSSALRSSSLSCLVQPARRSRRTFDS